MIFIKHRMNRIQDLTTLESPAWGAEIDLRSDLQRPGRLILSHDAWQAGDDFDAWLDEYIARGARGPLILNTKEDGLEDAIRSRLEARAVGNFFFLDTAPPTLIRETLTAGRRDFALRLSVYEPVAVGGDLARAVDWLWVDCFNRQPLPVATVAHLSIVNKVLVSPELQGGSEDDFPRFVDLARACTHICTKHPRTWQKLLAEPV